ncbi:MAG: HAD family hydrolase [Enterobacterales bacterium]|nr:HAD family hydrolase [Enterobacterales bacterium]
MKPTDYNHITVIGFDADDTLWVNENYFREGEQRLTEILAPYETANTILQQAFRVQIDNLPIYGYGIKGFVLSMVETALQLSNYQISPEEIEKIVQIGKDMLHKPVILLDGVEEVLKQLEPDYRLLMLTKGDLLDQERKLAKTDLDKYFHHVEVLSEKKEHNYQHLLDHLDIKNEEFLMVGNSLKSDVLPLINMGAQAVHIPYHTTWEHEQVKDIDDRLYETLAKIRELPKLLGY